jgi:hypothetical protein
MGGYAVDPMAQHPHRWGDDLDLLGRAISRGAIMQTDALIMRTVAPRISR